MLNYQRVVTMNPCQIPNNPGISHDSTAFRFSLLLSVDSEEPRATHQHSMCRSALASAAAWRKWRISGMWGYYGL